ncbi:MAG: NADH-quinone oxidoreductase subunit I [Firmicutes bacterium]|nr:NADH-quinone oxidoreductase subunit I [Bacillota bacterium]
MNLVTEAFRTGKSLVKGLAITFREMVFEEPVTVQYPEERPEVPDWFRGIPVLKTNLLTGEYKCTACMQCAEACPVHVIHIEWHQNKETKKKELDRFAIDMSRCMLCNLCVEACPFDSLVMANEYELCKVNPENLVFEMEDLLKIGLKYSRASVEPHGRSVKGTPTWIFAKQTGATEADIQDPEGYLGRPPLSPTAFKEKFGAQMEAAKEGA